MITIKDYIEMIYTDFHEYISKGDFLCDLKNLNYQAGNKPDYSNLHIQQLYLLRYVYAYAFEYKSMYIKVLDRHNFKDFITVTSIGCGNLIDYWGLVEACKEEEQDYCKIIYKGIDIIDWNYKIEKRLEDDVYFAKCEAAEAFNQTNQLESDIYIFPKSISEFSEMHFNEICESFKLKHIVKDKFHLLISLRADAGSMERDMERSRRLIESIECNGFSTATSPREYIEFVEGNRGIRGFDKSFIYSDNAISLLRSLSRSCLTYKLFEENCSGGSCKIYLDRYPTLKVSNIKYQIFTFERED